MHQINYGIQIKMNEKGAKYWTLFLCFKDVLLNRDLGDVYLHIYNYTDFAVRVCVPLPLCGSRGTFGDLWGVL